MARKKQEIQLQTVLETQEEWEEMLSKEGLTVVDVFQEWAGPCKAMVSNFRRLKNELGDDLLRFSVAKSDTVDSLEKYRGKCQPCFLLYGGGVMVAVVRGCNAPVLLKTVTEQLAYEHKVLDGQAERKEIRDSVVDTMADKDKEDDTEDEEEVPREVTVALLRPDLVAEDRVDEVLLKLAASGLNILKHEERSLTDEEAREFYSHSKDEEYFEGLVQLMTSGPSHVLIISTEGSGKGVIQRWRELLGPANVETAKEEAPDSFRAHFGKEGFANALHGSDSHDTAMKELAFFFPKYAKPTISSRSSAKKKKIQRTLALIRPDAVADEAVREGLLQKINEAGFEIAMQKEVTITKEQAEGFYKEHQDQPYFEELTTRMSSGPLLALCLAGHDAVEGWRELLGPPKLEDAVAHAPESLRARYSIDGVEINQIHGAETVTTAENEINFFFPMQQTVAVIKPDAYEQRDEIMDKIKEAGFHIAARKETDLTKEIVEQLYKDQLDKDYFGDLEEHMISGPTLFMVLTGIDAVENWRSKMGPTDPKRGSIDTFRGMYGTDVKANALHGASTQDNAREVIQTVFGDLEFDKQGKLVGGEEETGEKPKADESAEQGEAAAQETEQTQGEGETQQEATEEAAGETQGEETQAEEGEGAAEPTEEAPDEGQTQEAGGEEGGQEETTQAEEGGDETQQEAEGEEQATEEPASAGETPAAETEGQKEEAEGQKEEGEGQKEEGEGQKEEVEGQKEEGEGQKEEGEGQKAEGEGQKEEGEDQKAEGESQKAEGEGQQEGESQKDEGEGQKDASEGQKEESEGQKAEGEGEKPTEDAPAAKDGEQGEEGEPKEDDTPAD